MAQVQVFPCPKCKEFIASDAERCRFCQTPLDPQIAQVAAAAQATENKRYRRSHYRKHLLIGAGLFALGLVIAAGSDVAVVGGRFVLTWGVMVVGAGDFLYGAYGLISESFSK